MYLPIGLMRAQGIFTEAGLYGMFCFISFIALAKNRWQKTGCIIGIVFSASFGAFLLMLIYFFVSRKKYKLPYIVLAVFIISSLAAYMYQAGFYGGSSILRFLDFIYGVRFLIDNNLLFWGGYFGEVKSDYIITDNGVSLDIEDRGTSNGLIKLLLGFNNRQPLPFYSVCERINLNQLGYMFLFITIHMLQPITFSLFWFVTVFSWVSISSRKARQLRPLSR